MQRLIEQGAVVHVIMEQEDLLPISERLPSAVITTIMDIDFNRILQDQELTRAILGQGAGSLAEVQRLAQGAEGLEIESRDRITVTLR